VKIQTDQTSATDDASSVIAAKKYASRPRRLPGHLRPTGTPEAALTDQRWRRADGIESQSGVFQQQIQNTQVNEPE